jgi:predicted aldo/keto reductase-like oxidoreductase
MKALGGGVLDADLAFAYLHQYPDTIPIWGIQRSSELQEILSYYENPPELNAERQRRMAKQREELGTRFCRMCGYCLPCTVEINIIMAARMPTILGRARDEHFLSDRCREMMAKVKECTWCRECESRCPYELKIPEMLEIGLQFYENYAREYDRKHGTGD